MGGGPERACQSYSVRYPRLTKSRALPFCVQGPGCVDEVIHDHKKKSLSVVPHARLRHGGRTPATDLPSSCNCPSPPRLPYMRVPEDISTTRNQASRKYEPFPDALAVGTFVGALNWTDGGKAFL